MGQDPSEIREEMEETRAGMGDTVDAIGYKTDGKSRAGDSMSEKKDAVTGRVRGAAPDTEGVKETARRGVGIAKENRSGSLSAVWHSDSSSACSRPRRAPRTSGWVRSPTR